MQSLFWYNNRGERDRAALYFGTKPTLSENPIFLLFILASCVKSVQARMSQFLLLSSIAHTEKHAQGQGIWTLFGIIHCAKNLLQRCHTIGSLVFFLHHSFLHRKNSVYWGLPPFLDAPRAIRAGYMTSTRVNVPSGVVKLPNCKIEQRW